MYYLDKARQALQVECLQRRVLGRSRLFTHPGDLEKLTSSRKILEIRMRGPEQDVHGDAR